LSEKASGGLPRIIALEGASNVRDLGGYRTHDGGTVKFGRVFRAARLSDLTEQDGAKLRAAGIGRVVDLRGPAEQEAAPTRLAGVAIHDLSIDPSLGPAMKGLAARGEAARADIMALMAAAYASYAMAWHHRYAAMFDLLLEDAAPALLFHCTAGKDRTGFGAALILAALGVDRATIEADYLATAKLWRGGAAIREGMAPVAGEILTSVHPMFLNAGFAAMEAADGSVAAYLETRMALTPARQAALRAALVG